MRAVNGIELDDGVDEPDAHDYIPNDNPSLCPKGHGWLNLDGSCSSCIRNKPNNHHQHTTGPWNVERCHLGHWVKAGESYIVQIPDHIEHEGNPCGSISSQDKDQATLEANARLIAAAPELLEALTRL